MRILVSFSGGGFRATLFHLGAISYLNDTKLEDGTPLISKVTNICGVSGGSIFGAYVALNWGKIFGSTLDSKNGDDHNVIENYQSLINFVRKDIRGHILRRTGPFRGRRTKILRTQLDALYKKKYLSDIPPESPSVAFMATNLLNGQPVVLTDKGYTLVNGDNWEELITDTIPASLAVSASAAFPIYFPPVKISGKSIGVDTSNFGLAKHFLSDGGVIDNVGSILYKKNAF